MRPYLLLITIGLLLSCGGDESNRNPYLQEVSFTIELELSLPLYTNLNNIGNPVYVGTAGVGTRGIFVMQVTPSQFFAFEASCPNHAPSSCSTMTLDGILVECACEGYTYNLFNGEMQDRPDDGERYYDMLFYNSRFTGTSVIVSN